MTMNISAHVRMRLIENPNITPDEISKGLPFYSVHSARAILTIERKKLAERQARDEELKNLSLSSPLELVFSRRTSNALIADNYKTVGDLVTKIKADKRGKHHAYYEFMRITNFGKSCLDEVQLVVEPFLIKPQEPEDSLNQTAAFIAWCLKHRDELEAMQKTGTLP